ncbi:hypothetical protein ACIF8T_24640 [Streptomyces sp. NPDC085946]|uniref:hypothetical protein n=1 Tax=Streptomyces sp. NPDC085946 TaxID=3365744 RepID=UPI0037D7BD76
MVLQRTNAHGDTALQLPLPGTSAPTALDYDDYANADPCNSTDTTGLIPKCGKAHKTNGHSLWIITGRRGGGVTRDGHRCIGYCVETRIKGFANRHLSRNAVCAETWGTRPGKRKTSKLQGKASWYTPWKKQWEGPLRHPGRAGHEDRDPRQRCGPGAERLRDGRLVHLRSQFLACNRVR